ncbi:MAG: hypothetical protein LQ351_006728 [Letrouitia transgressa]|nr:MAG: hypothetical protein LQ351_006728 [Letrouitia transgressa]
MDSRNSIWVLRLPVELQPLFAASPHSYLAARTVDDIRLTIIWFKKRLHERRIIDAQNQSRLNREQGTGSSHFGPHFPFPLPPRITLSRETNEPSNEIDTELIAATSAIIGEEKEFAGRIKSLNWLEEFGRPSLRKVSHPENGRSNWIENLLQVQPTDLKRVRSCLINHEEGGQPEYSELKSAVPKDAEILSGPRKAEIKCLLGNNSGSE